MANGGLGQTVGRLPAVDKRSLNSLTTVALLLGGASAAILVLTADIWAALWGNTDAVEPIRWLAISAFLGPSLGLCTGLWRREGRFRDLAVTTLIANLVGMVVGAAGVFTFGTASSLLISPIVAQIILYTTIALRGRAFLWRLGSLRGARNNVGFSARVTVSSIFAYVTGNVGSFTASRFFPAGTLGQWNRADTLTTVPFLQVQSAMVQAAYPEFRHDVDSPNRASRVWPQMLTLLAWGVFPAVALSATLIPVVLPLLFGPGWDLAARLAVPLSAVAGIQILTVALASALEAIGRFEWIYPAQGAQFLVVISGAVVATFLHDIAFAVVGFGVGLVVLHLLHLIYANRAGYLRLQDVFRGYGGAVLFAGVLCALVLGLRMSLPTWQSDPLPSCVFTMALVLSGVLSFFFRAKLPPYRIAKELGIF